MARQPPSAGFQVWVEVQSMGDPLVGQVEMWAERRAGSIVEDVGLDRRPGEGGARRLDALDTRRRVSGGEPADPDGIRRATGCPLRASRAKSLAAPSGPCRRDRRELGTLSVKSPYNLRLGSDILAPDPQQIARRGSR